MRWFTLAAALGFAAAAVAADEDQRGFSWQERFEGSYNTLGWFTRLDSTFGYHLNHYLDVDLGLPVYFVRSAASAIDPLAPVPQNGIGNVHAALRLHFERGSFAFSPSLTATAPTGDENKGLSTGRPTWDWSNRLEFSAGRLTPYAELGLANTISDTPFFTRPFTSLGRVGHFEGGAEVRLTKRLGLVASAYAIEPSGTQTIVSRVLPPGLANAPGQQNNRGRGRGKNKECSSWRRAPSGRRRSHAIAASPPE